MRASAPTRSPPASRSRGREPVILDFATSVIAQGKTRVALNKGELVPPDSPARRRGRPTRDPRFGVNPPFGAMLAFGEHKGYGMALLCELLGGALAAGMTQHSRRVTAETHAERHAHRADRPRRARGPLSLRARDAGVRRLGQGIAAARRLRPVRIAGEPEREKFAQRTAHGVPVDATTWKEILDAARKLGVDPVAVEAAAGQA